VSFFLVFFLKILSTAISESVFLNREELSPYECGFEHHNVSRIPFSLRYFFLTLLFLLFDLEVILLLFVPSFVVAVFPSLVVTSILFFLLVLFLRLLYE
jgi:NADH-ubiquinone oxidoreductase chain 3